MSQKGELEVYTNISDIGDGYIKYRGRAIEEFTDYNLSQVISLLLFNNYNRFDEINRGLTKAYELVTPLNIKRNKKFSLYHDLINILLGLEYLIVESEYVDCLLPSILPAIILSLSCNDMDPAAVHWRRVGESFFLDKISDEDWMNLEKILILTMEHGFAASTLNVRIAASTGINWIKSFICGISAWVGKYHGASSSFVIHMVEDLIKSKFEEEGYLDRLFETNDMIWGFGHRIHKSYSDPRAALIQKIITPRLIKSEYGKRILNFISVLKKNVLEKRGLNPNFELYLGVYLMFLNVKKELIHYFVLISRCYAWYAHYQEQKEQKPILRGGQY
ncbi:MAG: citrate/2-methylcitrate synthase [Thermodesulfobacteriota bacterium]|nr:citrate/2-methylcitrate synthase [Thermodesulfobacteriota bacterium]